MEPEGISAAAERIAGRFSMQRKRALVTGGTLSIGRAIVMAFADAGADLATHHAAAADTLLGEEDTAAQLTRELDARGVRHVLTNADFAVPGEATRTVERAMNALGGVDVLVACASVQQREPFVDISPEHRDRQTQINFYATIELLKARDPGMSRRRWGRILTIGSVNQTRPDAELAVYAALKSAQHSLAINLARQYAADGITVNTLSLGLVATSRNKWRRIDAQQWRAIQAAENPMRRACGSGARPPR